jgi:hypothetical protein
MILYVYPDAHQTRLDQIRKIGDIGDMNGCRSKGDVLRGLLTEQSGKAQYTHIPFLCYNRFNVVQYFIN